MSEEDKDKKTSALYPKVSCKNNYQNTNLKNVQHYNGSINNSMDFSSLVCLIWI